MYIRNYTCIYYFYFVNLKVTFELHHFNIEGAYKDHPYETEISKVIQELIIIL